MVEGEEECDDGNDDQTDGCLATCKIALACSQILDEDDQVEDGVYEIDPDADGNNAPFDVYCDMSNDGGGWTLVAKVHRYHQGASYDEPLGWFAEERDVTTLVNLTSYEDRVQALASHGSARLDPVMDAVQTARFTMIAEDDTDQRATWFKAVDDEVWSWFSATDHAATQVCTDVAMSQNCSDGKIVGGPGKVTWFEGMNLSDHGYTAGGDIHMRHNEDAAPDFSALCSYTFGYDANAWDDDAVDGHWGNGLEVWFR
jgi:cysteine-rich repeat protein